MLAVDIFIYRIGRELGSLVAALGGLDAIAFTESPKLLANL
jgi:acetate kinase